MSHALELRSDRLRLIVPDESLAGAIADYMRRNQRHFAGSSPASSPGDHTEERWVEVLRTNRAEMQGGRSLRLFLVEKESPTESIVGNVSFSEIMRGPFQACFLGYRLDEAVQGRGYMREALTRAISYGFDELALHRIMANYRPTNVRSGKLLRSLGFQPEGFARDYLYLDGAWQDHILTALTNPRLFAPVR